VAKNNSGFWSDELTTLYFSKIPLAEALLKDNSAPAFGVILRFWQWIFGESEMALKLLPLLISFSTLIIAAVYGHPLLVFLLAFNPISILDATQLKSTALFEMFALIYGLSISRFCYRDNGRSDGSKVAIYLALSSLFVGVHYLAIISIEAFGILLFFKHLKNRNIFASMFVLIAPLAIGFGLVDYLINFDHLGYLRNKNLSILFERDELIEFLTSGAGFCLLIPLLSGLIGIFSKKLRQSFEYKSFLLAMVLYVLLSEFLKYSLFTSRYLTPLFVFFAVSVAAISKYRFTTSRTILNVACSILVVIFLWHGYRTGMLSISSESWKQAAKELCVGPKHEALTVWGAKGLRYYFPDSCARIRYIDSDLSTFCGEILIPSQYTSEFIAYFNKYGPIERVKEFGNLSIEPLSLLRKNCALYK